MTTRRRPMKSWAENGWLVLLFGALLACTKFKTPLDAGSDSLGELDGSRTDAAEDGRAGDAHESSDENGSDSRFQMLLGDSCVITQASNCSSGFCVDGHCC